MDDDEQKWPATKWIFELAIFSAIERACLGSQASSPTSSASFLLSTPPAALRSATACSAPFFICRPNADSPPVIGPATPLEMSCANAAVDSANDVPNAKPISFNDFMDVLAGRSLREEPGLRRDERSGVLSAEFAAKSSAIFRQIHIP